MTVQRSKERTPQGLARVRKKLPPPAKIFKSKKEKDRQRSKEEVRQELKETLPDKSA